MERETNNNISNKEKRKEEEKKTRQVQLVHGANQETGSQ